MTKRKRGRPPSNPSDSCSHALTAWVPQDKYERVVIVAGEIGISSWLKELINKALEEVNPDKDSKGANNSGANGQ